MIFQYRKFKVALHSDSKKSQGLQPGDIVRRQYVDGSNVIYTLMCVLESGVETVNGADRSYFIGALLEGNAPQTHEPLDFVRVTNLFDESRSGAMYLTASDEYAPYMDVIDGIGRNESLCWPEGIADEELQDSSKQYIPINRTGVTFTYTPNQLDNNRIVKLLVGEDGGGMEHGITQEFYQLVANQNAVIVSYKIRASKECQAQVSLKYLNDVRVDGAEDIVATTDWEYHLHVITVDWAGRHLRKVNLVTNSLNNGDWLEIADFNVILLSSVSNFKEASQIRIGKLDGVSDPVFGRIDSYGGYFKKLFVTGAAQVSGTLTAGDENGFGSTFYAGKIHRNVFVNSLNPNITTPHSVDTSIGNPTGVGRVSMITDSCTIIAQGNEWLLAHIGKIYTLSFWSYIKTSGVINVKQNNKLVGTINIPYASAHKWERRSITFKIQEPANLESDMEISFNIAYSDYNHNEVGVSDVILDAEAQIIDGHALYFVAPQLEFGCITTQYQATDEVLNYTEEYGAWFNRGGIGGTIQNPLLRLNCDGYGAIGTNNKSFKLAADGSGFLANENISWDHRGKVTFGNEVSLNWNNFDKAIQQQMLSKSIKITGPDTFNLLGDESSATTQFSPQSITLTITEENISSTAGQRTWYYLDGNEWKVIARQKSKTLTILPDSSLWNGNSSLTVKCEVVIGGVAYTDSFTIRKQFIVGYTVKVSSSNGQSFKNNVCNTVLRANVFYQGKLVDPEYVANNFTFVWKKYHLPDIEHEIEGWWQQTTDENGEVIQEEINRTAQEIHLNYAISGEDMFTCELQNGSSIFPYTFPAIF